MRRHAQLLVVIGLGMVLHAAAAAAVEGVEKSLATTTTTTTTTSRYHTKEALRAIVHKFEQQRSTAERGILYTCYDQCLRSATMRTMLWHSVRMARQSRDPDTNTIADTPDAERIRLGIVLDADPGDAMLAGARGMRLREAFDDVIVVPALKEYEGWFGRIVAWLHTPYQVTMTMDSDAWLCLSPTPVFEEADILQVDLVFAEHEEAFSNYLLDQAMPDNGVVLFRRSPGAADAFRAVFDEYVLGQDFSLSDQVAFLHALFKEPRSVQQHERFSQGRFSNAVGYRQFRDETIPPNPSIPGQRPPPTYRAGHPVLGPIFVMHVRALVEKPEDACAVVNERLGTRVIGRLSYNLSSTLHVLESREQCEAEGFLCPFPWFAPHNTIVPLIPGTPPWEYRNDVVRARSVHKQLRGLGLVALQRPQPAAGGGTEIPHMSVLPRLLLVASVIFSLGVVLGLRIQTRDSARWWRCSLLPSLQRSRRPQSRHQQQHHAASLSRDQ